MLIPSLRHPMTAAASIAGLEALAPGRVVVGVGSGFTGRHTMGKRPLKWATVANYVRTVQALLRGEQAEWEGAVVEMLHPEGFGANASGATRRGSSACRDPWVRRSRTRSVTARSRSSRSTVSTGWCNWRSAPCSTKGRTRGASARIAAAGPAVAVLLHGSYEQGAPIDATWAAGIEALDERTRHLAIHDLHLIAVTERDRPYITGDLIRAFTYSGSPAEIGEKVAAAAAAGVTEIAYQPAGPDIPRELRAFAAAAANAPIVA